MKRLMTVLLAFVISLSLLGCGIAGSKSQTNKQPQPAQKQKAGVVYANDQYGFDLTLPLSWKGYRVLTEKWEGQAIGGPQAGKTVASGPKIVVRHPEWTAEKPRQDIPIMVITKAQWDDLLAEEFHIGAAPIGPNPLDRNSKYVFALPARYNFAFPTGYEEVEKILNNHALVARPGKLK
ncbi:MAG: hypothetical protein ACM3QZ_01840 [Solirubrobacterales bacterium]